MQDLLKLQTLEFGETGDETTAAAIRALRAKIPPPILAHYDRFQVRDKKGLAAAINQVCTGCHMRLPLAVIMNLKRGHDIQLCDSCGRYLYLPAEAESAPAAQPIATKSAPTSRRRKKPATAVYPAAVSPALVPPVQVRPRISPG